MNLTKSFIFLFISAIPYKDDNPRFSNYNLYHNRNKYFVYLLQFHFVGNNPQMAKDIIYRFGFIPNDFNVLDIITSMFMHGGFGHIIGNMCLVYLVIMLKAYLVTLDTFPFIFFVYKGALGQLLNHINNLMVGASGAIAEF